MSIRTIIETKNIIKSIYPTIVDILNNKLFYLISNRNIYFYVLDNCGRIFSAILFRLENAVITGFGTNSSKG